MHMTAMHVLVALSLAQSILAAGLNKAPTYDMSSVSSKTKEGKFVVRDLREKLRAQLPKQWSENTPFKESAAAGVWAAGCLAERSVFARNRIRIQLVANEDQAEFIAGSRPVTRDITTSTSRVDISSQGWSLGKATSVEASASVGGSFAGIGASATVSGSHSRNEGVNQENTKQTEQTKQVSTTFECPEDHACSVQTWTFVLEMQGDCTTMPVYEATCSWPDAQRATRVWANNTGAVDMFSASDKKQSIELLPLRGIHKSWETVVNRYYVGGSVAQSASKVPLEEHNGVWQPGKAYGAQYKTRSTCTYRELLRNPDGGVKSTQVILERKVTGSGVTRRGEKKKLPPPKDIDAMAREVKVIFVDDLNGNKLEV
ncbi:Histone transcription regulator 3 [Purpureocillium lavendulum]|uniref:Histone transcription regulator 3 n=1 Tax=Purpureocillium lavendulum TaxID=1247861 RepID=A0AB34G5A2_9HYPO|nr:Histone transcription regulator 3 [Purpureocillium lavendulum]